MNYENDDNQTFELDLSKVEPSFTRLTPGVHFARITGCMREFKQYLKSEKTKATGNAITWKYETFGNSDLTQNNKTIFQTTPLDGIYAKVTSSVVQAANPDLKGGKLNPADFLGKEVEITLHYNRDNATGKERDYPNVKYVRAYIPVGSVGNINDLPSFDDYNTNDGPKF